MASVRQELKHTQRQLIYNGKRALVTLAPALATTMAAALLAVLYLYPVLLQLISVQPAGEFFDTLVDEQVVPHVEAVGAGVCQAMPSLSLYEQRLTNALVAATMLLPIVPLVIVHRLLAIKAYLRFALFAALVLLGCMLIGASDFAREACGENFHQEAVRVRDAVSTQLGVHPATLLLLGLAGTVVLSSCCDLVRVLIKWLTTHYTFSWDRVEIVDGLFNQQMRNFELWRIVKISLKRRWFETLVGAGTLTIEVDEGARNRNEKIGPIPHAKQTYKQLIEARLIAGRRAGAQASGLVLE